MTILSTNSDKTVNQITTTNSYTDYQFDNTQSDVCFCNTGSYSIDITIYTTPVRNHVVQAGMILPLNDVDLTSFSVRSLQGNSTLQITSIPSTNENSNLPKRIDFIASTLTDKANLGNTIVAFGDSITARIYSGGSTVIYASNSYFNWAQLWLKQRFNLLNNAGVPGETTTQMLARIKTSVLDFKPVWCIVEGGINDCQGNFDPSTTISNLTSIYQILKANNINVIATTVTPLTGATTSQKNFINRVNTWIKSYCMSNSRIILCDWNPYVTDPVTLGWATGLSTDNIHPTIEGCARMAKALYDAVNNYIPYIDILTSNNADPDNLLTNPMFDGNQGNGLATSWSVSGDATYTLSKVARTDGRQGFWQQLAVTVGGTSSTKITQLQTAIGTAWNVGDSVYGTIDFEIDPGANGYFYLGVLQQGGADNGKGGFFLYENTNVFTYYPSSGVYKTPAWTMTTGATRIEFTFAFKGTGTIRIGRAKLCKA